MGTPSIPPTVDVDGACDILKVNRTTVLDLIATGKLRAGKLGRSYVMLTQDVLRLVEQTIMEQTSARLAGSPHLLPTVHTPRRGRGSAQPGALRT